MNEDKPVPNASFEALVRDLRTYEVTHDPEWYPLIQMKQITALLDAIEGMIPALDRLQEHLEKGARIAFQDGMWWLFRADGEGIAGGKSIRGMLLALILREGAEEEEG